MEEQGPEQRLAALIGRWHTQGWTADEPAMGVDAIDTYEWLPGRYGLLHTVDARMGDDRVEGAEIIGWDPARDAYVTQYFGSDGPAAFEATLTEEQGVLVWRMRSESMRFTGSFGDGGNEITGSWELLGDDDRWRPWMEITLTRS
jgi:Protein of unknown function (DUF1579)